MKQNYTLTFLILASIIGAGFASGKEIYVFFTKFGVFSFVSIIISFILFYVTIKLYLDVGKSLKPNNVLEANKIILGKHFRWFNVFYVACLFVVLAGMFAGVYEVYFNIVGDVWAKIFVIVTIILCVFETAGGIDKINKINNIFMPATIIMLVLASFLIIFNNNSQPLNFSFNFLDSIFSLLSAISYVGINVLLSGGIFMIAGKNYSKKNNNSSALFSSFILVFIIFIFNIAMLLNGGVSKMPMLNYAFGVNQYLGFGVLMGIWFCIYSAITSLVYLLVDMFGLRVKNKFISGLMVVSISYVISMFGFGEIVTYLYPVIGVVGVIFTILLIKNEHYAKL